MSVSINTNLAALCVERRAGQRAASLAKGFERLSSGLRINRAGDDAAGLAISESLRADSLVYGQGIRNLNDAVSVTNIAESALSELANIVIRIQELSEQAANGTVSSAQRNSLDAEAQSLSAEYTRIARTTEFNGLSLLDGTSQRLRFQAGYGASGAIDFGVGGSMGTGTVSGTATYLTEYRNSEAVALGDLNGDGMPDLVSAGESFSMTGSATVRLNRGDGTFGSATSYDTEGCNSGAVKLVDLNNDGRLDLITAGVNYSYYGVATVRLGSGDGTFGAALSYTTEGGTSHDVTIGDVNQDGIPDLVTAGNDGVNGGFSTIRLGAGNGTFGAARSYSMNDSSTVSVQLADLNGDNILDLFAGGESLWARGEVVFRLGVGDGTFLAASSYFMNESFSWAMAIRDINGDGKLDLITAGQDRSTNGEAVVRLNQGDGTFGAVVSYLTESKISWAMTLADMDGDGALDLITGGASDADDGYVTIFHGGGDGSFSSPVSTQVFQAATATAPVSSLTTGDVNGDGVMDVVATGYADVSGTKTGWAQVLTGDTREGVGALPTFSLRTRSDALETLTTMQRSLVRISSQRAGIGATQSRLSTAVANLGVARENFDSAKASISDVDVAAESSRLIRDTMMQRAATAILAQANTAPQLALELLS